MKIYLLRHAESSDHPNDSERPLSEKGQADIKKLAAFLAPQKIQLDEIWHSNKVRTMQTAQIIMKGFVFNNEMEGFDHLSPHGPAEVIQDEIEALEKDVLIVSHLPFLLKLVSRLLTNSEQYEILSFTPGTIVCMSQQSRGAWIIDWTIPPDILK